MESDALANTEKSSSLETKSKSEKAPGAGGAKWRWVLLALVVFGGLWIGIQTLRKAEPVGAGGPGGAAGPGGAPQGPPPATVFVAPVVLQAVQQEREVIGSLRAVARAAVAAQESGKVNEVLVDVGDRVRKGDLLAKLDDRRIRAELAQQEAMTTAATSRIAERDAEAERAEQDLKMKEDLFSQRAVSEREFLDAKREAAVARARADAAADESRAAASALDLQKVRLEDFSVAAPFDGIVVERHIDGGEWLAPGEPVVTLVSTGTVEAWIQVPERYSGQINDAEAGLEIVADGSGLRAPAKSIRQVADVDATTRLFSVVVEVDDLDGKLVPGLSVRAGVPVGTREERLAVPFDAVIETAAGASVFRAAPGEGLPVAERVAVEVLFRDSGSVYLASEQLKPGDRVVVEGNERLFPGTPLLVSESGPSAPGEGALEKEVKP